MDKLSGLSPGEEWHFVSPSKDIKPCPGKDPRLGVKRCEFKAPQLLTQDLLDAENTTHDARASAYPAEGTTHKEDVL